jgi:hypothetical protein
MIYSLNQGFSIDFQEKYYFDFEVSESDFGYKVVQNRLASFGREKYPLIAFKDESDLKIFLPNRKKPLVLKGMKSLEFDESFMDIQTFEQGQWQQQIPFMGFRSEDKAYKLALK